MKARAIHRRPLTVCVMQAVIGMACVGLTSSEAIAKPRVERVVERRIVRLETMERRMEAAAQMPPRPADVRRALRAGVPVQGFAPAPAGVVARPTPRVAPLATPRATPPAARETAPQRAVVQASPRPVPQPSSAKPVPSPAAEPPAAVSPVTAIDDGTRSVLVGGDQPAAPTEAIEPIELLPSPPAK